MPENEAPDAAPVENPQPAPDTPAEGIEDALKDVAPQANEPAADEPADKPADPADPDDAPIKDWSGIELDLPEGAAIDEDTLESFGQAAVELGLSKKTVNALAKWDLERQENARKTYAANQEQKLRDRWGKKADAEVKKAFNYATQVCDDDMRDLLNESGLVNNAAFVMFVNMLANAAGEHGLKAGGAGAGSMKKETALEGILSAYRDISGRRGWDGR